MFEPEQTIGFVIGLLVFLYAGYLFLREYRNYQRSRSRQRIRDVAAIEELAGDEGGGPSGHFLARKYQDLLERSGLKGWRIFGDK